MQRLLRLLLAVTVFSSQASAQCGAGYTQAQVNWDVMDFLNTNNSYSGYVTNTMAATQKFMFARQQVTISHNYTGTGNMGNSSLFTATTGSNATGTSVRFMGNGTITVTFASAVQNVLFSIYDVDVNQRIVVSSTSNVTLSQPSGGTLTFSTNGTTSARADAASGSNPYNSNAATLNVSIPGSITSFTITVTNTGTVTSGNASNREDGSFFLSDIYACTNVATYPANYFSVAQPWSGQPGYVLVAVDEFIYYVNPATGKAKLVFTDPSGNNINSFAYDPNTGYMYYTYSLTASPSTNKKVMRYDYNTGTLTTWINDLTTLGIAIYESGVESGAAAFYDGALYLGIEGYAATGYSSLGRKSIVWRIDISGGNASGATQAYAAAADNGTSSGIEHDWSDIGIQNGVLYDFDGAAGGPDVYQYNMYTGAVTRITPSGTWVPRQICVDYNGVLYSMDGTIAQYNGTNNIVAATQKTITSTVNPIPAGASWGDGGEAFRPRADFGDAPSTYDPVATSPAQHELRTNLRLGAAITNEWTKSTSLLATGDADDGMPTPTIVVSGSNYQTNVTAFNNTGAAATVCAWVDFNNNGVFDASEGVSASVPSSASAQTVQLFWPSPSSSVPVGGYTFIRIRITSSVNSMTTSNPTGWFDDGEVEDYRIQVNAPVLPSMLVRFDAKKRDLRKGELLWQISDETPGTRYLLQRSTDGRRWSDLQEVQGGNIQCPRRDYTALDLRPADGINYYRLQVLRSAGTPVWSGTRELHFGDDGGLVLSPNPARGQVTVQLDAPAGKAEFRMFSPSGQLVHAAELSLPGGGTTQQVPLPSTLPAAVYTVEIRVGKERYIRRLVLER